MTKKDVETKLKIGHIVRNKKTKELYKVEHICPVYNGIYLSSELDERKKKSPSKYLIDVGNCRYYSNSELELTDFRKIGGFRWSTKNI